MKKSRSIFIVIVGIILTICMLSINVNAAGITGWAALTDEQSDAITKKQEEEQQKYDYNKSTNNNLKSLSVEGYDISPTFERQTVNYKIDKEINEDTINIKAEVEDTRAQVIGIGKTELKPGQNKIEVSVVAESGTVKTYFIEVTKKSEEKKVNGNVSNEEKAGTLISNNNNENDKDISKKTVIAIVIVLLIAIMIFFAMTRGNKKGKRSRNRSRR